MDTTIHTSAEMVQTNIYISFLEAHINYLQLDSHFFELRGQIISVKRDCT